MTLHVSVATRRAAPMHASLQARLRELSDAHGKLPRPPQAGRTIGLSAGRRA